MLKFRNNELQVAKAILFFVAIQIGGVLKFLLNIHIIIY